MTYVFAIVGAGGYLGYKLSLYVRKKGIIPICFDTNYNLKSLELYKHAVVISKDFSEVNINYIDTLVAPITENSYRLNRLYEVDSALNFFKIIKKAVTISRFPILLSSHRAESDNHIGWWIKTLEKYAFRVAELLNKEVAIVRLHNFYGDDEWERDGYISFPIKCRTYSDDYRRIPVHKSRHGYKRYFADINDVIPALYEVITEQKGGLYEIYGELVDIEEYAENYGEIRFIDDPVFRRLEEPKIKGKGIEV